MLFLTATPQGDPVALVMVLCVLAVVAVMAIRKRFFPKKAVAAPIVATPEVQEDPVAVDAPGAAGQFKLHNVDPKVAAMAMAIVADKLGKPLNQLRFISIQEVEAE